MREFSQEEIVKSLKDDELHMTIASSLFLKDIKKIEQDLQERNRSSLAQLITSSLIPTAVSELTAKNVIENNELTNIGLAHVHVFLQEYHLAKQMELSGNIPASEKVNDTKETEDEENEMKAIIYLSLSKFDIKEITQLFNDRKEKILTYYLAKNMNDAGIKKLLKYKIVTLQNTITDLGWKEIENYIKITGGDVVNKQKVSEVKEPEVRNAEQKHKKWWEFWK